MKTILIIIGGLLISTATLCLIYYNPFTPTIIDMAIICDKTDTLIAKPNADDAFNYIHLDEEKWQRVQIHTLPLTNFDYNPTVTFTLPNRFILFSNPHVRDQEIAVFKQKVSSSLAVIDSDQCPLPQSSIYITLVKELNAQAKTVATKKVCLLYSDCGENSRYFSIFDPHNKALLKYYPDQVQKLFEGFAKPGNLSGIEIHFIFSSHSAISDENFMLMSNLFKKIFADAGATVFIESNL